MTGDRLALIELIEKGADNDLVRAMLAFAAEQLMEAHRGRLALISGLTQLEPALGPA